MKYEINDETYNKLVELGYEGQSRNIFDISIWLFEKRKVTINTPRVESFYGFNEEYGYKTEIYYRNDRYPSTFGRTSDTPFDALKFGIVCYANNPDNTVNLDNVKLKNLLEQIED